MAIKVPYGAVETPEGFDVQVKPVISVDGQEYETVAASAAAQVLGSTGAAGDLLIGLLVVPASLSPGAITIKDGADGAITVFAGGANSVGSLVPFTIYLNLRSRTGAWAVTTGQNVSVIASGDFT